MKANFVISSVLTVILFGSAFGLFVVDDVFAQNLYVSSDDSEAYKKQKELEAKKAERQAKSEEKQKELEAKKAERQAKSEEKQKELEAKKAERQAKSEEKQKELEAKKAELKIHRENLELKQLKKSQEYEEKLKEIKEKSQYSIAKNTSDDEDISQKSKNLEEKTIKKSDEVQKKLAAKSDKLDLRTKNILVKINDGQYMGEKITSSTNTDKYELSFDLVDTYLINDKSQTSSLTGKMSFSTYDKSKSDLKLELDYCEITVDEIVYNCGFGKARTVSSGQSGAKDSLVIVAFLEDNVLEEVHTTMKIFLNADIPINKIEESQVSILGPQSKISNLWFLNGTATLSKIVSTPEQTPTGTNSTITLDDGISTGDK